jgi:hypothetical protein
MAGSAGSSSEFDLPFPVLKNEHAEDIFEESMKWAEDHRLLDEDGLDWLRRCNIGLTIGLTNPLACPERLRIIGDWYVWLYSFDDGVCDESCTGQDVMAMTLITLRLTQETEAQQPEPADSGPHGRALRDIRSRLEAAATPRQRTAWELAVREYLVGQLWESAHRAYDRIPEVADYIRMREYASGCETCFSLLAFAGDYETPASEPVAAQIRRLTQAANRIVAWDNDYFSYQKEQGDHGAIANLVTSIGHHHSCSPEEAARILLDIRNRELSIFRRTADGIRRYSEGTSRYIEDLGHWLSGSLEFHRTSARFAARARTVRGHSAPSTAPGPAGPP